MKPRVNEIAAGIFVIIMFFIFIVFLSWASGRMGEWMNRREITVYSWFHNTGGLKTQVQVTYQGMKIGDVKEVIFDEKRKLIQVKMTVDADFTDKNLPEYGVAMITTASLLGDPYIEITSDFRTIDLDMLVRGDSRIIKQKDESGNDVILVDAIDPAGWGTIQVQASNLLRDVQNQFGVITDTIGSILRSTNEIISDTQLKRDIKVTMANARIASEQFPGAMTDARAMLASANSAAGKVEVLIDKSEDTIISIIENADETAFNARALTFALSERPSRLVWDDKERQAKIAAGDTSVIFASWRKSVLNSSGEDESFRTYEKPGRENKGNWGNPSVR